jgi:hypothetical protein
MANEFSIAVGDGHRRMTYNELAQAKGISLASARRLVRRHGWPRQVGNDGGIVRVLVPLGHLAVGLGTTKRKTSDSAAPDDLGPAQAEVPGPGPMPSADGPGTAESGPRPDLGAETLAQAIAVLREQLILANARGERAERRADQAEERAADKDRVIENLREEIRFLYRLLAERRPWWRRWFR